MQNGIHLLPTPHSPGLSDAMNKAAACMPGHCGSGGGSTACRHGIAAPYHRSAAWHLPAYISFISMLQHANATQAAISAFSCHRQSLMLPSSPAEASSVGSAGCHLTQLTSSGCACRCVHSSLKEPPSLPPPPPPPLPPSCCFINRPRRLGSTAAASAAAAAASPLPLLEASPNMRMALSALPLAIRPDLDQSTEKTVRS